MPDEKKRSTCEHLALTLDITIGKHTLNIFLSFFDYKNFHFVQSII